MGFFDGACQGGTPICSVGFILHFSENHYIVRKANLGVRTNNLGEFSALYALLKCATDENVQQSQLFGDSELVIMWMQDRVQIGNLGLLQLVNQLKEISLLFQEN